MKKEYIRFIHTEILSVVNGHFKHDFKFWSPDSKFHYPHLLFSMALLGDDNLPDEVIKNNFIFGDSGGFHDGKKEFTQFLNPEWIIRKQEANCDAGFILDKPPWKIGKDYDQDWFERCARITKEDGDKMYELQEREDFKLYGIIQGRNREEWDFWYDTLTKEHDYDYWGMSPAANPDKINTVIDFGFWAKEKGIKDFHVLGVGRTGFVSTYGYLVNKLDLGTCTCDTSALLYNVGVFFTMLPRRRARDPPFEKEFQFPYCICPVCQMFDEQYQDNNVYTGHYSRVHTLYHYVLLYNLVNSVCDCKEDLFSIETESKPYINRIDELLNNGPEKKQGKLECF